MKFLSQGVTQSQSLGRHSLTLQRITRATVRVLKPRSQSRKVLPHEQTIMKNGTRTDIRDGHLKLLGNGSTEDPPIPQTGGGSERREAHGCMSSVEIGLEGAREGLGERNDEPGEQRVLGIGDEVLGKWCVEEGSLFDVVEESGGFKDLGIGFVSEEAGGDGENPEGGIDDNLGGNGGGGVGVGVDYLEAGAENDAAAVGEAGEGLEGLGDGAEVGGVGEGDPEAEVGAEDAAELLDAEFGDRNGDSESGGDVRVVEAGG
ncbi:uncharacterized protein HKW66_Vig0040080 [Vigna angularis]|uniref:Uncharacterized protein n=1 Tax=Phaseolus angularis TaxID=3914 RepID=A0A8T0LAV8_PHAAN|nr:uncharacterized protein HKW66_Vig0040080 [Vigna angularis]